MLSVRLKAIADCVPEGTIVADIGTDHAFLPVELIASGKIKRAYACDIGTGPLEHARATVVEAGLQAQISLILTPGLEKVPQDAQVAVIAGMGWMTAKEILENDFERLGQFQRILVQVNREVASLRRWIMDHGFEIVTEKLVHDRLLSDRRFPQDISAGCLYRSPAAVRSVSVRTPGTGLHRILSLPETKLERIARQIEDPDKRSEDPRQIEDMNAVILNR